MKKVLSLFLGMLLFISSTPNITFADTTMILEEKVKLADAAYVRKLQGDTALGGASLIVDWKNGDTASDNRRVAFVKYDFSEYEGNWDNISEITFNLSAKNASTTADTNYVLYLLSDDKENWSGSALTYTMAHNEMDMVTTSCGECLFTSGNLENNKYTPSCDIKEAVIAHLKANPSNKTVCFKIDTTKSNAYIIYGKDTEYEPYVSVKETVDLEQIVQKEYDALTFERINTDPIEAVTSSFSLISEGAYGTTIRWESSNLDVISPETGVVTQQRIGGGNRDVTLTATIENGEVSLSKTFEVTVLESNVYPDEYLQNHALYSPECMYIRSGEDFANTAYGGSIIIDARMGGSNRRMGFVKFDFTGCEDILSQIQMMTLRLEPKADCLEANGNNFVVYVLPNSMEDISSSTLTYNSALDKGLVDYTDNLVYEFPKGLIAGNTYETTDLQQAIKANLEEDTSNKTVWFKIAATAGIGYSMNNITAADISQPALLLKYPKPIVQLDRLSLSIPESVQENIVLPTSGRFGSDIAWESSDESLVSKEGSVTIPIADEDFSKDDPTVSLTATISYGGETEVKSFDVRVVRKGVVDASSDTSVSEEGNFDQAKTIDFGGTNSNVALIYFDIAQKAEIIKESRKTVLKIYGDDGCVGRSVTVSCITDPLLLTKNISSLNYAEAKQIYDFESPYNVKAEFGSDFAAYFDVTEYVRAAQENKLLFSLSTGNVTMRPYSLENGKDTTPKLIASPIAYTDAYAAAKVAQKLTFSNLSNETADNVRNSLTLPTHGIFGAAIDWTSSDEAVIDASSGRIERMADNKSVTLTAKITVGNATMEKHFDILVIKKETDMEYAEYLVSTLKPTQTILASSTTLPGNNLPETASVTWRSSEEYEAAVDGLNLTVTRPLSKDLSVILTATVHYKEAVASKEYVVTIIRSGDKNILRNRKIISGDSTAVNAVDENLDTVWNITNKTVIYDLGSAKIIAGMTLLPTFQPISGLNILVSNDNVTWTKIHEDGSFAAEELGYIRYEPSVYGRYVKLEFNGSASAIKFLAAYTYSDAKSDEIFSSVVVPESANRDFTLSNQAAGKSILWQSSSNAIVINGTQAVVTQQKSGINVTLVARVTVEGTEYSNSYVVYVPGTGSVSSGGSGGGSNSGAGGSIVAAPIVNTAVEVNNQFDDISSVSWAKQYINYLADKNIVCGKQNHKFFPDDYITREEIAKILVLAFDIQANPEKVVSFEDVTAGDWYESYVFTLVSSGGANGMSNSAFGIGSYITRQDSFKMLASVLNLDSLDNSVTHFGDDASIADYARAGINALCSKGIISGYENGNINPAAYITRAEAAKIICLAIGF